MKTFRLLFTIRHSWSFQWNRLTKNTLDLRPHLNGIAIALRQKMCHRKSVDAVKRQRRWSQALICGERALAQSEITCNGPRLLGMQLFTFSIAHSSSGSHMLAMCDRVCCVVCCWWAHSRITLNRHNFISRTRTLFKRSRVLFPLNPGPCYCSVSVFLTHSTRWPPASPLIQSLHHF